MAVLFALGVMSVGWMVLVAALIAIEKLLPWKAVANYGIAVFLVALGLAVAFVPAQIPGLVLPNSAAESGALLGAGESAPARALGGSWDREARSPGSDRDGRAPPGPPGVDLVGL